MTPNDVVQTIKLLGPFFKDFTGVEAKKVAVLDRLIYHSPSTINELFHEVAERVNLEHLDLICKALTVILQTSSSVNQGHAPNEPKQKTNPLPHPRPNHPGLFIPLSHCRKMQKNVD